MGSLSYADAPGRPGGYPDNYWDAGRIAAGGEVGDGFAGRPDAGVDEVLMTGQCWALVILTAFIFGVIAAADFVFSAIRKFMRRKVRS